MTERKKIGPRVPPEVWEAFKDWSEEKHGKQGMASEELTEAMLDRMAGKHEQDEGDLYQLAEQIEMMRAQMDYLIRVVRGLEGAEEYSPEGNAGGSGAVSKYAQGQGLGPAFSGALGGASHH